MSYSISLIPGDGVGPELVTASKQLLNYVSEIIDTSIYFNEFSFGNQAIRKGLCPSNNERIRSCVSGDAVLLGNIWLKDLSGKSSPHEVNSFLGEIRKQLKIYANIRPINSYESLSEVSPLKHENLIDTIVVREMSQGLLGSEHKFSKNEIGSETATDFEYYDEESIKAIGNLAIAIAEQGTKKIINVDKAIVLSSSQLWRKILKEMVLKNPSVTLENKYIDDVAADIIVNPNKYNVILTTGMFGDILSDEVASLTGISEILPSIEKGVANKGLYSPLQLHNSEDDIIGMGVVNPLGILSATSWLVRMSLDLPELADKIDVAIRRFINEWGFKAIDQKTFTTDQITKKIIQNISIGEYVK